LAGHNLSLAGKRIINDIYQDIFLLSMLKRHLKLDIEGRAKEFPNLARLSKWVNELIPCNFDVLKVREEKMF